VTPRPGLPGLPPPLGASWDGNATTFAVRSAVADRVELCLLDGADETRVPLERLHDVWRARVPGAGPGTRYGYRVHGPATPEEGGRCDPAKLLTDPYARALTGALRLSDDLLPRGRDSAGSVPQSLVLGDLPGLAAGRPSTRPRVPWRDTVVYEVHVKGFTALHPGVPEPLRGTFAGLGSPAAVEHLLRLGVTTVELLPVQHAVSELHLLRRGLTNYWGYNTLGFFAPDARLSAAAAADPLSGGQEEEFAAMVAALHEAGLEVVLDVVYNHTAEGDAAGPTLCWRGYDDLGWYRHVPGDPGRYDDVTGCGSTLDLRRPHAVQLVLDSLRHFVEVHDVDGFRFDLAPALTRGSHGVDWQSAFLTALRADPLLSDTKLIAEAWDIGPGGYQVGGFPPPFAEWDGTFRDGVRTAWLDRHRPGGSASGVRDLGYALAGSSRVFDHSGKRPWAAVAFVTAHDGFPLADLVAYDGKHNEANGEGNRDGDDHNRSWNCGVEGPTDDPEVLARRERLTRALLATLLLSAGTPLLLAGDERGRSQGGNNNAYCQDGVTTWHDWSRDPQAERLQDFVAALVRLRAAVPALRPERFYTGRPGPDGLEDVTWWRPDGTRMSHGDWHDDSATVLVALLAGEPGGPGYAVVVNTGAEPARVVLPGPPYATSYEMLVDSAAGLVDVPSTAGTGSRMGAVSGAAKAAAGLVGQAVAEVATGSVVGAVAGRAAEQASRTAGRAGTTAGSVAGAVAGAVVGSVASDAVGKARTAVTGAVTGAGTTAGTGREAQESGAPGADDAPAATEVPAHTVQLHRARRD
jgi:isoamylase